jgi:hypothetical protein
MAPVRNFSAPLLAPFHLLFVIGSLLNRPFVEAVVWKRRIYGAAGSQERKSVYDEPTALAQALDRGASGFALKRTATTELIDAVDVVVRGEKYVSAAVGRAGPERPG